jgi:predicted AAA+ superfamily ATPase
LSSTTSDEDLEIDPKTAKKWVGILDSLYYSFQLSPFGSPKIRAVKKEQKLYLWDWSQVEDEGARFENMVASHLLTYCHFSVYYQVSLNGETRAVHDQIIQTSLKDLLKRKLDLI